MLLAAALVAIAGIQAPLGELPFRIGDDAIIVDAVVNGKKLSLMFDSGYSGSIVLNDAINVGPPSGEMTLRDFVGTFKARTVPLKSLTLGNQKIEVEDMEIVQQPMAHMSLAYNTHTDGILGFQAIKNYVTEINFEKEKFIFHPASLDVTKRKPDNVRTFLSRLLPIGGNSLEMDVVVSTGKKMVLGLDTGNAFYATTHKDVLERVGLWTPGRQPLYMRSVSVASGPVDSWIKRMSDVVVFGVPVKSSVWDVIDRPSSSAEGDGTVGFGFLKNFNFIIDYGRRRVWLDNFTGQTGNEPKAETGMFAGLDARLRRVRVFDVIPGSPAEKAGIREHDQLLAINGRDLGPIGFRRVAKLLEGEAGTKVKLDLSRNGNLMRLEVERVYLVND